MPAIVPAREDSIAKFMGKLRTLLGGGDRGIEIVDEGGVRHLHIGGRAIQSAIRLDAPDRLELDYVRAMMAFLLFRPQPRHVLMVGLGGGSMARFIHQRMPRTRVTVAEIDAEVLAAARKYFHFPQDDRRLRVVIGDGASIVPGQPAKADVLVLDGFDNGESASGLCTQPFYDAAFAALRAPGVLVANFMADDRRLGRHLERIEKSFGRAPTLLLAEEKDNMIAFAHRGGPPRIAWSELKARALSANSLYGLRLDECLPPLRRRNPHTARFLTL
jgi:spermidine synthase